MEMLGSEEGGSGAFLGYIFHLDRRRWGFRSMKKGDQYELVYMKVRMHISLLKSSHRWHHVDIGHRIRRRSLFLICLSESHIHLEIIF